MLLSALLLGGAHTPPELSPEDEAALRALEAAYTAAWVANDSAAVMATLAPDAVIMPGGLEPRASRADIVAFWWPDDGSTTTVTAYRTVIEELGGSGDTAWLRGRGELSFTYETAAGERTQHDSRSVFLAVARRNAAGEWKIARRMWTQLP